MNTVIGSSSSAHRRNLDTSFKEVWFRTESHWCKRCPKKANEYLTSKQKKGEVSYFMDADTMKYGFLYAEGYFDATQAADELCEKLCNPVRIDSPVKESSDETNTGDNGDDVYYGDFGGWGGHYNYGGYSNYDGGSSSGSCVYGRSSASYNNGGGDDGCIIM